MALTLRLWGVQTSTQVKSSCFPSLDVLLQLYEQLQSFIWSRLIFEMSLAASAPLTNIGASLCACIGLAIANCQNPHQFDFSHCFRPALLNLPGVCIVRGITSEPTGRGIEWQIPLPHGLYLTPFGWQLAWSAQWVGVAGMLRSRMCGRLGP